MLQKIAQLLGVDKERTIVQSEPVNTYEEAKMYAENYDNSYPVILVTSATHMERAMMMFERFGLESIPSPTNYRLKGSRKQKWIGLPSIKNIENMNVGIHEYIGMFWYGL